MPKALSTLSKFQAFTIERWPRSKIKNAPYNPRTISPAAARKLRSKIKTRGLVEPPVVNRKTGILVSGHQRLAALDALEGSAAYELDVAVVSLTPKQEREMNLFLNNVNAQGDWDQALLANLLTADDVPIDVDETGFEELEIETLLGDEKARGIFGEDEQPEEVNAAVDDITGVLDDRAEEQAAVRQRRQDIRTKTAADREANDSERIAYVMFPSRKAREDWVESLGLGRDERYVPHALAKKLRR